MPAFVATTALGAEPALVAELAHHQITAEPTGQGAVRFDGPLDHAYRALLWSRVASRVLQPVARVDARSADAFTAGVRDVDWGAHLPPGRTFAVRAVGTNRALRNTKFTALATKDGVVDRLRDDRGHRPDVDPRRPDLLLNVHVDGPEATVAIDLTGAPLHLRGGRDGGPAPLRETLAGAILWFADWPRLSREGAALVDPMCGSGTLLREAAGLALDRAPGLGRDRWGFAEWAGHDPDVWDALVDEARERARDTLDVPILGFDQDAQQVARARRNLERDDLAHLVPVVRRPWDRLEPPEHTRDTLPHGLVVANTPYGERLGERREAEALISAMGDRLRRHWLGWTAWLLVGDTGLAKRIGLKPARRIPLRNGPLDARVLEVPIADRAVARDR